MEASWSRWPQWRWRRWRLRCGCCRCAYRCSRWQIQKLLYLVIYFGLFQSALRGPADARALGIVLVTAAMWKAGCAVWVRNTLHLDKQALPFATSHDDSMLFAAAFFVPLAMF